MGSEAPNPHSSSPSPAPWGPKLPKNLQIKFLSEEKRRPLHQNSSTCRTRFKTCQLYRCRDTQTVVGSFQDIVLDRQHLHLRDLKEYRRSLKNTLGTMKYIGSVNIQFTVNIHAN